MINYKDFLFAFKVVRCDSYINPHIVDDIVSEHLAFDSITDMSCRISVVFGLNIVNAHNTVGSYGHVDRTT